MCRSAESTRRSRRSTMATRSRLKSRQILTLANKPCDWKTCVHLALRKRRSSTSSRAWSARAAAPSSCSTLRLTDAACTRVIRVTLREVPPVSQAAPCSKTCGARASGPVRGRSTRACWRPAPGTRCWRSAAGGRTPADGAHGQRFGPAHLHHSVAGRPEGRGRRIVKVD